jgi:ADP-ribose pyrophosphatase YjhB (NUDIX family)
MGNTPNKIRPLSLALFENGDKILAKKDFDSIKEEIFYRVPGGGIEFGETSEEALRREIKEEFNADIESLEFIEILENIFTYEGNSGHEIVFLYRASFADKGFYKQEEFTVLDKPDGGKLYWFDQEELLKGNFYPEGIKNLLK